MQSKMYFDKKQNMKQAQNGSRFNLELFRCGCFLGGPHNVLKTNVTSFAAKTLLSRNNNRVCRSRREKTKIEMSSAKAKPAKAPASHPKYIDMIVNAIKALADKSGSSRQAINKYIVKEYSLTENNHHNAMLKQALKRGSGANGPLVHNKGKGAAGSFKIKPAPVKPAKPAAKKAPAKKKAPVKKSAAKKGPSKKKVPTKPAKPVVPANLPAETPPVAPAPVTEKPAKTLKPAKPVKTVKPKVTKEKSSKKSKAASPKKPKVVKAKKSPKKAKKGAASKK